MTDVASSAKRRGSWYAYAETYFGPLLGIILIVSLAAFAQSSQSNHSLTDFNERFGGRSGIVQITPEAYEALRDEVAARPEIATAVIAAFDDDDLIDTEEMRSLVGINYPAPPPTKLTIAQARGDLYQTANAAAQLHHPIEVEG